MTTLLQRKQKKVCQEAEAFETDPWAIEAILKVEILTQHVVDPCAGLNTMIPPLLNAGYMVTAIEPTDWTKVLGPNCMVSDYPQIRADWFEYSVDLTGATVFMNPPFSLACEFVDSAKARGARKIVCFQRQAWRESEGREGWWRRNPPARIYVLGARANCWRFDISRECLGERRCGKGKGHGPDVARCRNCMAGSATSNAWYVWERGHRCAEVGSAIYPPKEKT